MFILVWFVVAADNLLSYCVKFGIFWKIYPNNLEGNIPTKMCIKSAPYLHEKSFKLALKIVQIEPLEGAAPAYFFCNYDAKFALII